MNTWKDALAAFAVLLNVLLGAIFASTGRHGMAAANFGMAFLVVWAISPLTVREVVGV